MDDQSSKRNLKLLYKPPPAEDYSKNYLRLTMVIVIACIFIAVQMVGGTISGSIAIISDAIHLVSDLLGFVFSFVFLYLSKKAMNEKVSFGYHRMELLGALANIFIVWFLILFVVYEATQRIIKKDFVQKPTIMLITSIVGLIINIVLYNILHGAHSHGLMADPHDHDHDHGSHSHDSHSQSRRLSDCQPLCEDLICKQTINEAHCHKGPDKSVHRHKLARKMSEPIAEHEHDHDHSHCESQHANVCKQIHQHSNTCYLQDKAKGNKQKHVCQPHHHKHDSHQHKDNQHKDHDHVQEHDHHDHDHHGHEHHDHEHHDHDHHDDPDDKFHPSHESIGMKAAVIHALSDLIQSVGVVISALVIYFLGSNNGSEVYQWNHWHLFDPISTYIFSILSLASTLPVIRNCYYLILESTPDHIDLQALRAQFESIEGVIDVHDIHVWDLKPGKTIMIAHVLAKKDTERYVLTRLTDLTRQKRIYHSTFQVEEQDFRGDENYILCHHDIH